MAAGTVTGQNQLFYCDTRSTLFLSEIDAQEHEKQSGQEAVQPEIVQN